MISSKELSDRSSIEELNRLHLSIARNDLMVQMLDGMNIYVMMLNSSREIIFMNQELCAAFQVQNEEVIGKRPGDLLQCKHSFKNELGCGYAKDCALCDAKNTMVEVIEHKEKVKRDVTIVSLIQGIEVTSNFEESVSRLELNGEDIYLLAFVDKAPEVDRNNLERLFYHDLLNSATSIYNVIRLLKMENEVFQQNGDIEQVHLYLENMIEEIKYQRSLTHAEKGQLSVTYKPVNIASLVNSVIKLMSRDQRYSEIPLFYESNNHELSIMSEPVLLRRILMNMVKNALEANQDFQEVQVMAVEMEDKIVVKIHNHEVIPESVQRVIFEKGSSTKGSGRGFGTYGSKLLLNKYLQGDLQFTSNVDEGTSFIISLPKEVRHENLNR